MFADQHKVEDVAKQHCRKNKASDDLLDKRLPSKAKIQHMNLQHGLFAKISTKNLIGGVGRSKEKKLS